MNNKQIISAIAKKSNCTLSVAQDVLNGLVDVITENVSNWIDVKIYRLGTFKSVLRKSRNWVNPRTSKPMVIPEMKSMSFTASSVIKKIVRNK